MKLVQPLMKLLREPFLVLMFRSFNEWAAFLAACAHDDLLIMLKTDLLSCLELSFHMESCFEDCI